MPPRCPAGNRAIRKSNLQASGIADALRVQALPSAKGVTKPLRFEGKVAKTANVPRTFWSATDSNMPVAKHHSGATLTLSMKNWMGSIANEDRRAWHRDGLHQCIADFSTFIRPKLVVIDATRIMLTKGPQGPGDLEHPNEVILSTDPVAADAYAATLFKKAPFDIGHIQTLRNEHRLRRFKNQGRAYQCNP